MIQCSSEMEVARYKFDKFEVDHRFLQRVPAISTCREASPPSSASTGDMDVRLRSGSMSSAYHAEYEESDSDTDHDCNAIDMSVIKNDMGGSTREQRPERMNMDLPTRGRQRALGDLIVDRGHGPPPPQLIMRDPHAPRDDLNRMTNESPLSSSGSSSSPSLLLTNAHNGLGGHGINHVSIESQGRSNGLAGPPLPPPPFLSQLAQPGTNHIMQQMQQQQHHVANGVSGGGILLAANDPKGRHSSFSSVNSSDGAASPPPHTLPNTTHHSGNPLNQHQLPFVPQHIPHDLVHKMSSGQKKKLPTPIPKECKDEAYWERRKRNNESAKRSRELRRIKEQQTTLRVLYLEQENLQLRTELGMLRSEVDKLRQLLYVTNKQQGRGGSNGTGVRHRIQQATPQAMAASSGTGVAEAVPESMEDDNQLNHHHASLVTQHQPQQQGNSVMSPLVSASPPLPSLPAGHQLLGESQGSHHQPLPPISTLQSTMCLPQGQPPRQIILASPPSRPQPPLAGHHSMTLVSPQQPLSPHPMSRSPSPINRCSPCSLSPLPPPARQALPIVDQHQQQGLQQQRPLSRRRELSISPQISAASPLLSRDAIDLSPLSPPPSQHRMGLSPSPNGDQARPLALVQPASDAQVCSNNADHNANSANSRATHSSSGANRLNSSNNHHNLSSHNLNSSQQSSYPSHSGSGLIDSCASSPAPNVVANIHNVGTDNGCHPQQQQQPMQPQQQAIPQQPHQQLPLQPAILRHKKARPSSPFRVSPSPSPPQQLQQQQLQQQQQQLQQMQSIQINHSTNNNAINNIIHSSGNCEANTSMATNHGGDGRSHDDGGGGGGGDNNNNNSSSNSNHLRHSQQQHIHLEHQQQQLEQQMQSQRQHSVVVQS